MNVADLIEILSQMDPEAEVRLASQPGYPMQNLVAGVASSTGLAEFKMGEEQCDEHGFYNCLQCLEDDAPAVVWLVEGGEPSDSPYASKLLWTIAESV